MTINSKIQRGEYGEIISAGGDPLLDAGRKLLATAIATNLIEAPYHTVKNRKGSALNYDIYDVGRGCVLVQQRCTSFKPNRFRMTKDYYLLFKRGGSVAFSKVEQGAKAMLIKRCRQTQEFGEAIEVLTRNGGFWIPPERCLMLFEQVQNKRLKPVGATNSEPLVRRGQVNQYGKNSFRGYIEERKDLDPKISDFLQQNPTAKLVVAECVPLGLVEEGPFSGCIKIEAFKILREIEEV